VNQFFEFAESRQGAEAFHRLLKLRLGETSQA